MRRHDRHTPKSVGGAGRASPARHGHRKGPPLRRAQGEKDGPGRTRTGLLFINEQ